MQNAKFFFVDSYASSTQKYYKYTSTDADLLTALNPATPSASTVQVSFIFASSLFILISSKPQLLALV